jgi:hypothetical protein
MMKTTLLIIAALALGGCVRECPTWADEELTSVQLEVIAKIERECVEFHRLGGQGPSCDFGSYSDAIFWLDAREAGLIGDPE